MPAHAVFALAEWGKSKAFVSFFPQSPPPAAVVGVRADRASARAGESVRVVGFARRRNGNVYRPATGDVALTVVSRGKTLASAHADLDKAGAFSGEPRSCRRRAQAGDAVDPGERATARAAARRFTSTASATRRSRSSRRARRRARRRADSADAERAARGRSRRASADDPRAHRARRRTCSRPNGNDDASAWGVTTIVDTTVHTDRAAAWRTSRSPRRATA